MDKSHLSPLVLDKHPLKEVNVNPVPVAGQSASGPPSATPSQLKLSAQQSSAPRSAGPAFSVGGGDGGGGGGGGSSEDDKGSIINTFTDELNGYAQTASNTISELFG